MPQDWTQEVDLVGCHGSGAKDTAEETKGLVRSSSGRELVLEAAPEVVGGGAGARGGEGGVLYSYHSIVARHFGSKAERRSMWGEVTSEDEVFDVFERFVRGHVPRLPWCERLERESAAGGFLKPLAAINHCGFLTINSQPRVNGVPSADEAFGWGPAGGFVFQKAYLEFFCSPANLERLLAVLPSTPSITLQAYDANGLHKAHRCADGQVGWSTAASELDRHVMAVTWGVFDGSQVHMTCTYLGMHTYMYQRCLMW